MTSHRLAVAAGVLALSVLASACSSSGSGTPVVPPVDPEPSSTSAPGPGASTSAAGDVTSTGSTSAATTSTQQVHVCQLLPAATLAALSGVPVTKAEARDNSVPSAGLQISDCNYTDSGTNQIGVSYSKSQFAEHEFDQDFSIDKSVISRTAMVSGIGEKAFTANFPSAWLEVLWDGATFKVDGATTLTVAQAEKIVTALHDKL